MNDPIIKFAEDMRTGVLNDLTYDKMVAEEVINKRRAVGAKRFKKKKMADKSKRRNR